MSPLLKASVDAGIQAVRQKSRPWELSSVDFFTDTQHARSLFAGLINASCAQDIAIVPSVSYGTAIAALNVSLNEDEQVLVLEDEFPSNICAWRIKAQAQGASIKTLKRPLNNETDTQRLTQALAESLKRVRVGR